MGNNGSVKQTLFRSYIIFTITTVALFVICLLGGAFIYTSNIQSGSREFVKKYDVMAKNIVDRDFRNINISDLEELDGWIEILDSEGMVIYSSGNVREFRKQYTSDQLYELLYNESDHYYINSTRFKGNDEKDYLLILRADEDLYYEKFAENLFLDFVKSLGSSIVVFLVLFFLNIYIFSRWVGARITNPLHILTNKLRNVPSTGVQEKIDYNESVEEEFVEIADSFNYMIDEIIRLEEEKREQEEDKQKLIVDISHDIKTPITAIQGYARAMSDGIVKDEREKEKYLNTICMKAQSVTELINLLFEYVKLDHKSYQLNIENKDINEVVRTIIAEYYEEIVDKGLELVIDIPDENINCEIDIMQIKRVVTNLVTNSLKYNKDGSKLYISVNKEDDFAVIKVGDNGVGIPKEIRGSVFEPFVRGEKDKASKISGSGIGLSIAKKIVDMHSGSITLLDEKGEIKSMFEIKVPTKQK